MSETFKGGDLAPKPAPEFTEQRPGQQAPGLAGQAIRIKPLYHVERNWPCSQCAHVFDEHKFLYGIGTSDKYECTHSGCSCGQQYRITAMVVDPNQIDTEEKRIEFMKRHEHGKRIERERFE